MNCRPYLEILAENRYNVISENINVSTDTNTITLVFNKGDTDIEVHLSTEDKEQFDCFIKSHDYYQLDLIFLKASFVEDDNELLFCIDDFKINDISLVTPDLFRNILKAKESYKSEVTYFNKFLQRYLDVYNNIIVPIVNPIIQIKGIDFQHSLLDNIPTKNRNIVIDYFSKQTSDYLFSIEFDYIANKLSFYTDIFGDIMWDFEDKITTKGRFKELLKNNGI